MKTTDQPVAYIWKDGKAVPASIEEWAKWFESHPRVLKQDVIGYAKVSTVFLGIDHGGISGAPLIFETMIFGGEYDQETWRYVTWAAAAAGHILISAALERGEDPRALDLNAAVW